MAFVKLVYEKKKNIMFKMFIPDLLKCCFSFHFPQVIDAINLRMRCDVTAWVKRVKPSGSRLVAVPALRA